MPHPFHPVVPHLVRSGVRHGGLVRRTGLVLLLAVLVAPRGAEAQRAAAAPPDAAPVLLAPADGSDTQPVNATLRWAHAPGATTYYVDVGVEPVFDTPGPHLRTYTVDGAATLRPSLAPRQTYYWRVVGCNIGGCGSWSPAHEFTTGEDAAVYTPSGFGAFLAVANGAGPLDPPGGAGLAEAGFPVPSSPDARQQVGAGTWVVHTFDDGTRGAYDAFVSRVSGSGIAWSRIVPYDFEIRFTERGSLALDLFSVGRAFRVPFELWRTGIDTPDDPSDDLRLIPHVRDEDRTALGDPTGQGIPAFNLLSRASIDAAYPNRFNPPPADHSVSPGDDDPQTDWIYWSLPTDRSPGEAGYQAWAAAVEAAVRAGDDLRPLRFSTQAALLRRTVLVNVDGGDVGGAWSDYNQKLPETGTVFRITSVRIPAPFPAAPADAGVADAAPTLRWHGAATRVQIARDSAFTDLVVDRADLSQGADAFRLDEALPDAGAAYYWRVGSPHAWSAAWRFTTPAVTRADDDEARPARLAVEPAHPNPFVDRTTLHVVLSAPGDMRVTVYDALGRRIAVLAEGPRPAGRHRLTWEAGSAPSGVYLVEATTPGARLVRVVTRIR